MLLMVYDGIVGDGRSFAHAKGWRKRPLVPI